MGWDIQCCNLKEWKGHTKHMYNPIYAYSIIFIQMNIKMKNSYEFCSSWRKVASLEGSGGIHGPPKSSSSSTNICASSGNCLHRRCPSSSPPQQWCPAYRRPINHHIDHLNNFMLTRSETASQLKVVRTEENCGNKPDLQICNMINMYDICLYI